MLSDDVLADVLYALDDDSVGRVDAYESSRIVDHFTLEEASTQRVSGEDMLTGDVVDVATCLEVDQAATNRLRERHRTSHQLYPSQHTLLQKMCYTYKEKNGEVFKVSNEDECVFHRHQSSCFFIVYCTVLTKCKNLRWHRPTQKID